MASMLARIKNRWCVAVLLLATLAFATSPAMAAAKKFTTPGDATAAPRTAKVANLRTLTNSVTGIWNAQPITSSYGTYLQALGKPATLLNTPAKQTTFKANLAKITAFNKNTKLKWTATPNAFTDLSSAERAKFLGSKKKGKAALSAKIHAVRSTRLSEQQILGLAPPEIDTAAVPASMDDLRASGGLPNIEDWTLALPEVKDQQGCGACWAFATTTVAEAARYITTSDVLALSEKQLVDCNYDAKNGNWGCDGGNTELALKYVVAKGLVANATFSYKPKRETCSSVLPPVVTKLKSYQALPPNSEATMLNSLQYGPIAVAVTADDSWFSYGGGVFSSTTCSGTVNHAVVIVGAGFDDDAQQPYWLVRNSWGKGWGEGGYMRLLRGTSGPGMCNVATFPYQGYSGDAPLIPPPPPPPQPGCPAVETVDSSVMLDEIAAKYKASVSQIMIDNGLSIDQPLARKAAGAKTVRRVAAKAGPKRALNHTRPATAKRLSNTTVAARAGVHVSDYTDTCWDPYWGEYTCCFADDGCEVECCEDEYGEPVACCYDDDGDITDCYGDGSSTTDLTINCSPGTWSPVYGVWRESGKEFNGMSQIPKVGKCPPGTWAVQFYMKPSWHFTGGQEFTGSTWLGQVTMTCSDGSTFKVDAQPGVQVPWADGNITLMTGFPMVSLRSGWALDSLFGVGAFTGTEGTYKCPVNTLVTGFSAGARSHPVGFLVNFQVYCSNPFGTDAVAAKKFTDLRLKAANFPQVRSGLSCNTHTAAATDTWISIAAKYKVNPIELMRSNPLVTVTKFAAGQKLFLPPCNNGVLQGTKIAKKANGSPVSALEATPFSASDPLDPQLVAHPEVPASVQYQPAPDPEIPSF